MDGASLAPLGQVADLSIQGVHTRIEEADETQLLFGLSNRGVAFIDASHPLFLPASTPAFAGVPVAQPSEGAAMGGTTTLLSGQNFEPTAQVTFGSQLSPSVSVLSATQIQTVTPPSVVNGTVRVGAYFSSGWLALAPDAFSYAPQVLQVLPNAGIKNGGEIVQIYGYGFGTDISKVSVKFVARPPPFKTPAILRPSGRPLASTRAIPFLSSASPSRFPRGPPERSISS